MYERVLPKVLRKFGLNYRRVMSAQKGYRNEIWPIELDDGSMVAVTFFKQELGIFDRVRRADMVSQHALQQGLPIKRRVDLRTLVIRSDDRTIHVALYDYLPGATIPWEAYTMKHIKLLGMALGRLHVCLRDVSLVEQLPSVYDEYGEILMRMRVYFDTTGVISALGEKLRLQIRTDILDHYVQLLNTYRTMQGQSVLHMDLVRGNVLFDDATIDSPLRIEGLSISGLLDFEKTAKGHPVVDVARSLAFLLVDCQTKSSEQITHYFIDSGYIKRGEASSVVGGERLWEFVELFWIYDFYKFLRHNPYESLLENHHFICTRNILLRRNMISYI